MNKRQTIEFLNSNSGYLKKSASYLADRLNISESLAKEALVVAKNKKVAQNASNSVLKPFISKRTSDFGMHIILPDVHCPFENKALINGVSDLLKDLGNKIVGFHLLGDYLDMNSLSSHAKGEVPIPGITLGFEYKRGNQVLDLLEANLSKNVKKTYLYGNHEDRYFRHISKSDNNKFADALIDPTTALRLRERGYVVKENWKNDYIELGKHLHIIHGEFCTANPAKTHLQKYKQSVIFGHTHRADAYYEGDMASFNIGSLADFNSPAFGYVSRIQKLNWMNAFALVQIDEKGFFHVQTITAYDNKFWYNGKSYGRT